MGDFSLVGHDEGQLRVHCGVSDEVPSLDGVEFGQVPLTTANTTAYEYPQRLTGGGVGRWSIILVYTDGDIG